ADKLFVKEKPGFMGFKRINRTLKIKSGRSVHPVRYPTRKAGKSGLLNFSGVRKRRLLNHRCAWYFLPVPDREYMNILLPRSRNKIIPIPHMMVLQPFSIIRHFHIVIARGVYSDRCKIIRALMPVIFCMPEKSAAPQIWLSFSFAYFSDRLQLILPIGSDPQQLLGNFRIVGSKCSPSCNSQVFGYRIRICCKSHRSRYTVEVKVD